MGSVVAWARRKSEGGPREGARATQAVRDASVSHTRNSSMSRTVRDKPHTHGLFQDGGCCPEHCHTLRRCQWRLATRRDYAKCGHFGQCHATTTTTTTTTITAPTQTAGQVHG